MRAELTEHVGIGDVNLRNILLMRSFGAREAEEICSASGVPTQLTRLWDARWRAVFGTRFGLYSKYPRAAPAKRPASTNTVAAAKRSVLRAAAAATQEVRDGVADATFAPGPGTPRLSVSAHWNAKFEKFHEQTKAKTVAARVAASQRKAGLSAIKPPLLCSGCLAPRRPASIESVAFAAPAMGDAAGKLLLLTGADALRRADLVIIDKAATLCECTTEAWAERLLYICALGKTVLARRA